MPSNQHRINRRKVLQAGTFGAAGVSLTDLLAADSEDSRSGPPPRADACILIFLNGGPSHLDMWDMKPDAPASIRGEFSSIATSLPGYRMGEHLPRLAMHAHQSTIVRSMHHGVNNAHAAAVYAATDYPTPGSVLSMLRPPDRNAVSHVCLPYITREGAKGPPQPGFSAGFLGSQRDPLFVLKDPNAADFGIPELTLQNGVSAARLNSRRGLARRLDRRLAKESLPREMTGLQARANDLLTSTQAQAAFRIADEPDSVRDSYGRNIYGQSL